MYTAVLPLLNGSLFAWLPRSLWHWSILEVNVELPCHSRKWSSWTWRQNAVNTPLIRCCYVSLHSLPSLLASTENGALLFPVLRQGYAAAAAGLVQCPSCVAVVQLAVVQRYMVWEAPWVLSSSQGHMHTIGPLHFSWHCHLQILQSSQQNSLRVRQLHMQVNILPDCYSSYTSVVASAYLTFGHLFIVDCHQNFKWDGFTIYTTENENFWQWKTAMRASGAKSVKLVVLCCVMHQRWQRKVMQSLSWHMERN